MTLLDIVAAALIVLCAVGLGTVAHELAHAAVLRAVGVEVRFQWLHHGGEGTSLRACLTGTWASVEMQSIPAGLPAWPLRTAALAPLALASPLALVAAGVLPDPFLTDSLSLKLAVVGWLACGLPSPQDFATVFHAEDLVGEGGLDRRAAD